MSQRPASGPLAGKGQQIVNAIHVCLVFGMFAALAAFYRRTILIAENRLLKQATLDALEERLAGADVLIISCRNLIRVDFSAAGTLLNWVSRHHAEGRIVQFVDVHRLVSAFFHVIGITEYSKVVLRTD